MTVPVAGSTLFFVSNHPALSPILRLARPTSAPIPAHMLVALGTGVALTVALRVELICAWAFVRAC